MEIFTTLNQCFNKLGGCGWAELSPLFSELLKNLLIIGIVIAVSMIMYAGYILVKGQGNPDSISKVKTMFLNILIGITLLVGSFYIVKFLLDSIGVEDQYRTVLPKDAK